MTSFASTRPTCGVRPPSRRSPTRCPRPALPAAAPPGTGSWPASSAAAGADPGPLRTNECSLVGALVRRRCPSAAVAGLVDGALQAGQGVAVEHFELGGVVDPHALAHRPAGQHRVGGVGVLLP